MKKNTLIACCLLFSVSLFAQKMINFPVVGTTSNKNLTIEQVELSDTATILRIKIASDPNKFWSISQETYIQTEGQENHLKITHAQGISLGQRMYTQNGISRFSLYFPPIDSATQKLNFIESDCESCFKIYDIDLSGKLIENLYSSKDYVAIEKDVDMSGAKTEDKPAVQDPKSKSSVTYNGSSYNLMFFWDKKKKANNPHWSGAGLAIANFDGINDTGADLTVSTSYSFVVNPVDYCVPLDHHWLLVSGAGIDWTRYHFKGNIGLQEVEGITQFVPSSEGETYKSSKLLTYYITIPLFLEYQTKIANRRTFFISGGMVGYIKCYSKSQIDVNVTGGIEKRNLGRDLNILPVNGRFMLQTGTNDIFFYAYYSPFSLFEKGKGPDVKPIGIGVILDF